MRRYLFEYLLAARPEDRDESRFVLPTRRSKPSKGTFSELDFDSEEVARLVRVIEISKTFSRRVLIYIPPFDSAWLQRSQQSWNSLETLKAAVAGATGASFLDLSNEGGFSDDDFVDAIHLKPPAASRFSHFLSQKILYLGKDV
jgi:hypothetical protein